MIKNLSLLAMALSALVSFAGAARHEITVPPPGITLDKATLSLKVGETNRLTATVRGSEKAVLWASSNPGFATVGPDGLVVAVHEGSLVITANLPDEPSAAECKVTVADKKAEAAPAAVPQEIAGIVIGNEILEMVVGDDLGIVATCLPYKVFESSPYVLETSNSNILQVSRASIATAVGAGVVTLTARTPNGKTDSITFEVKPAPREAAPSPAETYQVELNKFNIVLDKVGPEQARTNSIGVNQVLLYAQRWGYRNVVFPRGLYVLDPAEPISMRSRVRVDLNGSTWQIMPNPYPRYAFIRFCEMNGPNLFSNYDIQTETVTQKSLSAGPVGKFTVSEGDTSVLSLPIAVGPAPDRQAEDQSARSLEPNSLCYLASPIGVDKTVVDSKKPNWMEVRLKINYYSNTTFVAAQDAGPFWLRDSTAKLWCGVPPVCRLRATNDYNAIRMELQFALQNCEADIYMGKPAIGKKITAVLENSKLCNGTILGERDFKEPLYPNWKGDPQTEGSVSISFEEGCSNGIENLTVRKSIGFNMGARLGQQSAGVVGVGPIPVKFASLGWGDLDENGNSLESATVQRTTGFLDVRAIKDTFEFGLPLGYMGYNTLRARIYDIYFYDADKVFLERKRGRLTFHKYQKPQKAAWAKIVLHWDAAITSGHPDFSGAIGFITEYKPPVRNFIRNCVIEDNYSTGLAACGGINWRIEGNTFRRNGGRMPGCDIDWEDGWEYSQDDVIRNNSFESRVGLIVCAGINHVFKNNALKGNTLVYGRTQAMKFEGNTFGEEGKTVTTTFGTQSDAYIYSNRFLGGPIKFEKQHGDKGKYKALWLDNTTATNTTLIGR